MQTFTAGSAATPVSLVELTLSCRNLSNMDTFSKSDPFVVVYLAPFGATPRDDKWTEHKRTEVVQDNLNPEFATKITMAYHFEEQQYIRFDVYDSDSSSSRVSQHDFLGTRSCTLGELVAASCSELPLQRTPHGSGALVVYAEEVSACKQQAVFHVSGRGLDKKDWFWGKSDPYLELFKSTEEGRWVLVHRTEHIRRTLDPDWKPFAVHVGTLCNGDVHRNVRAVCWDWNANGTPDLIGQLHFSLDQLQRADGKCAISCVNPEKQKQKGSSYKSSGTIVFNKLEMRQTYTFLDYIMGGTQLACTIAIDFTASNGDPKSPNSLHYLGRDRSGAMTNPYITALRSVGHIIQDYDSDKAFPVLGFGARIPPSGIVSHEFFVNLHPTDPFCHGIEGVTAAYEQCLPQIQLYGPTNFAPVVRHVTNFARQYCDGSQYFILLVITDGVITDMPQTKQAIVDASGLPLSIIIVGVGSADFSAMEELDGDQERLRAPDGRLAQRDIVQFVPFSKFGSSAGGDSASLVRARLAREVLAEVPAQFVGYMSANGISPQPARTEPIPLPPDPTVL